MSCRTGAAPPTRTPLLEIPEGFAAMTTDDLTTPAPAMMMCPADEEAVARLKAAHHEFVSTPVISESLLMTRNVAVVQALEAGVPVALVQKVTRMSDAALELAVARGTYHRDYLLRCQSAVVGGLA
jgi:hypothetical protein